MTPQEVYEIWAPEGCIWSRWTKPVLFAHLKPEHFTDDFPLGTENISWLSDLTDRTAIVIDQPGKDSIKLGLRLTSKKYWPVPLYNSCPANNAEPLVLLREIMGLMCKGTEILKTINDQTDFLPAFLLDSKRLSGKPAPKLFDNRWMTFPQDFPSANFLLSQSIKCVLLIQNESASVMEDLSHILFRWQEAGIEIKVIDSDGLSAVKTVTIEKPTSYKSMWYRAMTILGLRRSSAGGFGAIVPEPSSSRGGFA